MRKICLFVSLLMLGFISFAQTPNIIPKPVSTVMGKGIFTITPTTPLIVSSAANKDAADFFNNYLQQIYGFRLPITESGAGKGIRLVTRTFIKAPDKDAYQLKVAADGVTIEGDTHTGTFYGIQTLIQLLPVDAPKGNQSLNIQALLINDAPRFAYRGMHLDVGRHMFPLDFIKKYIDYLALHKMNYFHWHLTEDQGWRIEIKKYPKLTSVGGYRNGTIIDHFPGTGNDNKRYGGFYTQEEVKEIVQYAAQRHITVVPEIEMPGHSSAAIAAYPWLSCFPDRPTDLLHHPSEASKKAGGKNVQETWGVFEDIFCAGKDSTFIFLQDVLDEVLPLFPSKYVHVGGDEAPKDHWRECPNCQARIKAEGLKDEHELQSYFIQRMEKYLNAKGRVLIGWDEILEGGLAPNAVVMSWRGEEGGIAAAKQNHQVIMTPTSHVYVDYSQSQAEDSLTIGGFLPVEKTYSYEPVPKELNEEQGKYILGAQANLWTEYIPYPSKVEYMIFPRMTALSEVLWSPKEARNWQDFEKRLLVQFDRFDRWETNYSKALFDITPTVIPTPNFDGVKLKLETKDKSAKVKYGISGVHFPKDYTAPVLLKQSADITVLNTRNGKVLDSASIEIRFNKATGKRVTISEQPAKNYPGDGAFTLVNGIVNKRGIARSADFLGFNGKPVTITIDLGKAQAFNSVKVHALAASSSWIHAPREVNVHVSTDGKNFTRMGTAREFSGNSEQKGVMEVFNEGQRARFVKIEVLPLSEIPAGLPGAGKAAWLFLDEVEVL